MKNHWLKVYRSKNNKFYTAEFTDSGFFILKPRKIELANSQSFDHGQISSQGKLGMLFKGAFITTYTDPEMISFLSRVKQSMSHWLCKLKQYKFGSSDTIVEEVYCCELSKLSFDSIGVGNTIHDVKVAFNYSQMTKYSV
jgi:hypothetical protein